MPFFATRPLPSLLATTLLSVERPVLGAECPGWTMLTTPAREPLEDFDFDEEEVAEAKPEE
ncbi:MAG: hypothetical protein ACE5H4_15400 [Candidatus Thorarchaeota archaeon]